MSFSMSRAGRRVVEHLASIGIDVDWDDIVAIEVYCCQWIPTRIIGVIDYVVRDKPKRLTRAKEQKWAYFAAPVRSLLGKSKSAYVDQIIDLPEVTPWMVDVYKTIMRRFIPHDINTDEMRRILIDIPKLCSDKPTLIAAIQQAKERRVRTVPYLHAILDRQKSMKRAVVKDRDAHEQDPWEEPEREEVNISQARAKWASKSKTIKAVKRLNEEDN